VGGVEGQGRESAREGAGVRVTFTIIDAPQRSPEWFQARLGRLTGSCAKDMFAVGRTKGEEAVARRDLKMRLVLERLTGQCIEDDPFINKEMQRGIDCEPLARAAYESATGYMVRTTGFLASDGLPIGCSLDGDVDDFTGIVEIKAPKSTTHLKYLRATKLPSEHAWQVLHNLFVTNAQWCDFVSWDGRFPPALQLHVIRVQRDDAVMRGYHIALADFLKEVDTEHAALRTMTDLPTVLEESLHAL
jgi:hypothetical protein